MPTTSTLHRVAAPALLTGLLATTTLATAAPATAAVTSPGGTSPGGTSPGGSADVRPASVRPASVQPEPVGVPVAAALAPAYRVVPGVRLRALPPPWVLPVTGYHLTGRFGAASSLWSSTHTGLDFAAPQGTEIRSIAPGVVTAAAFDGAYGYRTVVRLEDGTALWYCHQSEVTVRPGQRVSAGEAIGSVGSTGNVTGPHLHLEVRPGGKDPIDPEAWLPAHDLHP